MKIAIIQTPLVDQTGGERQALELAIELQRKGHVVTIFTPYFNKDNCYPGLVEKVNIISLSGQHLKNAENKISQSKYLKFLYVFRHYKNMLVMKKLGELIDDSYDVINPHNMPTHWAAFFAWRKTRKRIVWMCNEPPFWYLDKNNLFKKIFNFPIFPLFDSFITRRINRIVVLDKLNQERVSEIYHKDSTIIYSGLDTTVFQHKVDNLNQLKKKYNIEHKFVLLAISTLVDYKRPLLNIEVLSKLNKQYKDVHLILVGKGELEEKIYKKVKNYKLENSFTLLKNLTEKELANLYKLADIFLFPAIQTWGLVVIEAMANKLPVVVEEKSGVAEIIKDGNGYKVDFSNLKQVVLRVSEIHNNKGLKDKVGRNAESYVRNNFSWNTYADNLLKIFRAD